MALENLVLGSCFQRLAMVTGGQVSPYGCREVSVSVESIVVIW